MIIRLSIIYAVLFSLVASPIKAGEVTGTVTQILARSDGFHYVYTTGTATNKPACATSNFWAIKDENSKTGQHQFAMLLTAYTSGKTVTISGTNACTRHANGEDIDRVWLK